MPRRQHPPEVKQQAIELAAGQSSTTAAETLGLHPRTVQTWVKETKPDDLARYIANKRAVAQQIVLQRVEAATTILMDGLSDPELDPAKAKALQARAVALGIMDDHYGGRPTGGPGGTRFGTQPAELAGWSDADRVVLERIERVTVQPQPQPADQPPQVIDLAPPGVGKVEAEPVKEAQGNEPTPRNKRGRKKAADGSQQ